MLTKLVRLGAGGERCARFPAKLDRVFLDLEIATFKCESPRVHVVVFYTKHDLISA